MTASTQFLQQEAAALLCTYPKIATRSDLEHALTGISAVTVCGRLSQEERDHLQDMLQMGGANTDCHLVFATIPSLSVPREILLYPAHLTEHQLNRLLRRLYDTDAVICGILSPPLLDE